MSPKKTPTPTAASTISASSSNCAKANPVLIYGKYTLLDKDNPDVYAYTRELDGKKLLVLLNFKDHAANAILAWT